MKSKFYFVFTMLAVIVLASCGGGGTTIAPITIFPYETSQGDEGYFDDNGKIVINPQFRHSTVFRDGIALVAQDVNKWGFIDNQGTYLVNAQYKNATVFSEGLAWVVAENGAPTAIDKGGEIKFTLQDADIVRIFSEGLAAYTIVDEKGDRRWGFIDNKGSVVINPQFYNVKNYNEGRCAVRNDDLKWGYIDKKGTLIINHQFEDASAFNKGVAVVAYDNKYGLIDESGKYIINPQFQDMVSDGDLYLIIQGSKYGWCDKTGKLVINPQFSDALPFAGNDLAPVSMGDKMGYIDKKGKIIINPQFDKAYPFNAGKAIVYLGSKIGLIDKTGKFIVNPQFDDIPEDLEIYLTYGETGYQAVETDFLDINAITAVLNLEAPEGLPINSTYAEILNKFNLKDTDLGQWTDEHRIIDDKQISRAATYDFYILGSPWETRTITQKTNYYGYVYNTTSNVTEFAGDKYPSGFAYQIELTGPGSGKGKSVATAIEALLSGYTKDTEESSDDDFYYKNDTQEINLYYKDDEVILLVKKIQTESI